jgi:hypothetical protein
MRLSNLFYACILLPASLCAQTGESQFKTVQLSRIPKPQNPPNLVVSDISFSDKTGNGNNILDADEKCEIDFVLQNNGKGEAYALVLKIEELSGIAGLQFQKEIAKGNLAAGGKIVVRVPVVGSMALQSGKSNFRITVQEGNHFNSEPFSLAVTAKAFKKPELVIADAMFSNSRQEGKIALGEKVQLDIIVKNTGEGEARDVNISFVNPDKVYAGSRDQIQFASLKPGEQRTLNYEFFANKQYTDSVIPIQVKITESYGRYGVAEIKSVSLDLSLAKATIPVIEIQGEEQVVRAENGSSFLTSDVDRNIPVSNTANSNTRVLIIGNEEYAKYQTGLTEEANVDYAKNDARMFKEYCEKTLGIPAANIEYITDATSSRMRQSISLLNRMMKSREDMEVIFYYSGHGLPDPVSKDSYLIPVDVSSENFEGAIRLKELYQKLSEHPSKRVTVFLDACFSGGARNLALTSGSRGVKITPSDEQLAGNLVVFSASSGSQTSLSFREQKHGMFTYHLLKALQQSKGNLTYQELGDQLKRNVGFASLGINKKEQDPQVNTSPEVAGVWKQWRFK